MLMAAGAGAAQVLVREVEDNLVVGVAMNGVMMPLTMPVP